MEAAAQFSEGAMTACFVPGPDTALVAVACAEQRQLVRMTLASEGCTVVEARDSTAALAAIHDGLCAIARAPATACAIGVVSERLDPDRLRRIDECGARVVVQSPFSPAQLVSAVREAEAEAAPSAATQSRRHARVLSLMTTLAITD